MNESAVLQYLRKNAYFFLLLILIVPLIAPFNSGSSFVRGISWLIGQPLLVKPESLKSAWALPIVLFSGAFYLWLNPTVYLHKIYIVLGVFLFMISVSFLRTDDTLTGTLLLSNYWSGAIAFFLFLNATNGEKKLKNAAWFVLVTGSVIGAISILQYTLDFDLIRQAIIPSSTFGNKNMSAHFAAIVAPVILGLWITVKSNKQLIVVSAALCVLLVFLINTSARAAWLAVFVEGFIFLIFWLLYTKRNHLTFFNKKKIVALVVVMVVFVFLTGFQRTVQKDLQHPNYGKATIHWNIDRIGNLISKKITPSTVKTNHKSEKYVNERIPAWLNTLNMIKDHFWFGVGIGDWYLSYARYHDVLATDIIYNANVKLRHLHNDHLELLAMIGVPGYSALFLLVLWVFYLGLRFIKSTNNPNVFLVLGFLLGVVGMSINAFFTFPMKVVAPVVYLFVYLAIVAGYSLSQYQKNRPKSITIKQPIVLSLNALSIVIGVYFLWWSYNFLYAQTHYHQALSLKKQPISQFSESQQKKINNKIIQLANYSLFYQNKYYESWSLLGVQYLKKKLFKESQYALEKAQALIPDDFAVLSNLFSVYGQQKNYKKMLEVSEKTVYLYSNLTTSWIRYMQSLLLTDQRSSYRIKEVMFRMIQVDKKNAFSYVKEVAKMARQVQLFKLSTLHLKESIAKNPNTKKNAEYWSEIAINDLLLKKIESAKTALKKAKKIDENIDAYSAYKKAKQFFNIKTKQAKP